MPATKTAQSPLNHKLSVLSALTRRGWKAWFLPSRDDDDTEARMGFRREIRDDFSVPGFALLTLASEAAPPTEWDDKVSLAIYSCATADSEGQIVTFEPITIDVAHTIAVTIMLARD